MLIVARTNSLLSIWSNKMSEVVRSGCGAAFDCKRDGYRLDSHSDDWFFFISSFWTERGIEFHHFSRNFYKTKCVLTTWVSSIYTAIWVELKCDVDQKRKINKWRFFFISIFLDTCTCTVLFLCSWSYLPTLPFFSYFAGNFLLN